MQIWAECCTATTYIATDHIADEMRQKLVKAVVGSKLPFSILIDESANLSQKYIRCNVELTCEPVTVFFICWN